MPVFRQGFVNSIELVTVELQCKLVPRQNDERQTTTTFPYRHLRNNIYTILKAVKSAVEGSVSGTARPLSPICRSVGGAGLQSSVVVMT